MEAPDADGRWRGGGLFVCWFFCFNLDCAEHQMQTGAARALTALHALHLEEEPSKQSGGREKQCVDRAVVLSECVQPRLHHHHHHHQQQQQQQQQGLCLLSLLPAGADRPRSAEADYLMSASDAARCSSTPLAVSPSVLTPRQAADPLRPCFQIL